jgi:hypothetical protein
MTNPPPSWKGESDPVRLRELLIQDPHNVALRRQYLALRTPELAEMDRGNVRSHRQAAQHVPLALVGGAIIGLLVWAVSLAVVKFGGEPDAGDRDRLTQLIGVLRMFASQLRCSPGMSVSARNDVARSRANWDRCPMGRRTRWPRPGSSFWKGESNGYFSGVDR